MIVFTCKHCQQELEISEQMRERTVSCPECGEPLRVPAAKAKARLPVPPPLPHMDEADDIERAITNGRKPLPVAHVEEEVEDEPPPVRRPRTRRDEGEGQSFWEELPDDLPEKAYRIGYPTAVYKAKVWSKVFGIFCGIVFIGLGILGIIGGIVMLGQRFAGSENGWILIVLALAGIPVGVFLILWCVRGLSLRVGVFTDGLLWCKGDRTEVVPWDDIRSVWQQVTDTYVNGIYTGTTHIYTLERREGRKLVLNDAIANVKTLGETVQSEVIRVHLPKAIDAYNRAKSFASASWPSIRKGSATTMPSCPGRRSRRSRYRPAFSWSARGASG
jgi:hypothetical protein